MPKFFETRTGHIDHLTKDGAGRIVEEGRRPIDVLGTIPGEDVSFQVVRKVKGACIGKLISVEKPSPNRVKQLCPYAGRCGGCKAQHVDYQAQLQYKHERLIADFTNTDILAPNHLEPATDIFYYRNRMDYVFGLEGQLGLREAGKWWAPLNITECHLLSKETPTILEIVRTLAKESGLPYWKSKGNIGFFRYLVIREGKNTGERLIMLLTSKPTEEEKPLWEKLQKDLVDQLNPFATSIIWGIRESETDTSFAEEMIPLHGQPFINEIAGGINYQVSPNAFFQTNTKMAEKLQTAVLKNITDLEDKKILDLYCGSGFFTLPLAQKAKQVTGIELVEEAITTAKINAKKNNVSADFFVSKAEDYDWQHLTPDVVIVDPPRGGLHPKVIKTLLAAEPKEIIYVSCNYRSLLSELEYLKEKYEVVKTEAFDLFPHTPHVEVVVKFVLKGV